MNNCFKKVKYISNRSLYKYICETTKTIIMICKYPVKLAYKIGNEHLTLMLDDDVTLY